MKLGVSSVAQKAHAQIAQSWEVWCRVVLAHGRADTQQPPLAWRFLRKRIFSRRVDFWSCKDRELPPI